MLKIYSTLLLVSCLFYTTGFSQKTFKTNSNINTTKQNKKPVASARAAAPGCETINIPEPSDWSFKLYYSTNNQDEINGFITGNNEYDDQEKGAFFDVSSTTNNKYITKLWVAFGVANSNLPDNLSKVVAFKVYDGTTGTPGALLATVNSTLGAIKADVDAGLYTEIIFPTAVTIPASGKFVVSVDVTNLVWGDIVKDSLAIFSTDVNEAATGENGFGLEKYNNNWGSFALGWGANFGLYIHPFVSDNATCALLPVTLVNFKGINNGSHNVLSWATETEQDNTGFELQRSSNGTDFSPVAFVPTKAPSGNSTSTIKYQFDDAKSFAGDAYYRLKQIDKDGKSTLSSVVLIKGEKANRLVLSKVYPNPAKAIVNLVVGAPANDRITVVVSDLAGKVVMQKVSTVITGDNNISLQVQHLAPGNYMIKTICSSGCETAVSKFLKQ